MRVDLVSVFPEYFGPLDLSLIGKARVKGLLDLRVHDLRSWTYDRHRSVDDTPYGGGPGMVMSPRPWGDAIDAIVAEADEPPILLVTTPAGRRLTQDVATVLAAEPWLVIACGRYEGIDQRVVDHFSERMRVEEISIGDYVVGGGEVAALVVVEAVARLIPGVVGNPASLAEESHRGPMLEPPVYTTPPSWRGHDVPEVLLSGNHAAIARWRAEQALARTVEHRPDLAHTSATATPFGADTRLAVATPADAAELYVLQRCCWVSEAQLNDALDVPALVETLDDVRAGIASWLTLVVRTGPRLVASVRARRDGSEWEIGRLMVAPDLESRGFGRWLLQYAESAAPPDVDAYTLFTGAKSARNLTMYRRAGYRVAPGGGPIPGAVLLRKRVGEPPGRSGTPR